MRGSQEWSVSSTFSTYLLTDASEFRNDSLVDLLLTNLRIVDGRGGGAIEGGAIGIDGQRLAYVGPAAGAPKIAARTIDGKGRTAVPGLINSHTHISIDEQDVVTPRRYYLEGAELGLLQAAARGRRALENGITTVRDCNSPGTGTLALRTAFARRLLPGPRIFASARAICATGGHMSAISFEADGPDEVRKGVRQQLKAGADFIKLVAEAPSGGGAFERSSLQLSAEEMCAGVDVAHRLGKRVTAHAVSRHGVAEALKAGVDCIEHGYDLTDELIATMVERGTWLVPTLSVHDAILRHRDTGNWSAERLQSSERILATGIASAGRAFRAGVNVACGSDAGSPMNPVWELVPELRLLGQAGLTAGQALESATRRSAELIGAEKDLGTLEKGKYADVVVVDGDPLRDVGALEHIVIVIKDGEVAIERP